MAKIDSPETFVSGRPKKAGLSDPRLGTMDRNIKCQTDGAGVQDCPGGKALPCVEEMFVSRVLWSH